MSDGSKAQVIQRLELTPYESLGRARKGCIEEGYFSRHRSLGIKEFSLTPSVFRDVLDEAGKRFTFTGRGCPISDSCGIASFYISILG